MSALSHPMGLIVFLTLLGFTLVAVEVFIPGLIVGTIGALMLIGAIVLSYIEFGVGGGTLMLALILVVSSVGFFLWLHLFPRTFVGRRLMLQSTSGRAPAGPSLAGATGVTLTQLRPSGTAKIDGHRVDVVAESGFVAVNEPVRVVSADGMRVVVRLNRA